MIKKNLKNYLIYLKYKLKKKQNNIKKSIVHNNNLNINKFYYLNLKKNIIKKINISQLSLLNKGVKKKVNSNRWEIVALFNDNKLINFKKWCK